MSTLEDKVEELFLGTKLQNYCSSSEDENDSDTGESDKEYEDTNCIQDTAQYIPSSYSHWDGTSSNTGPKGVMQVQYHTIYLKNHVIFIFNSFR